MGLKKICKNRRAISPASTAMIIAAVAIVIALAVAGLSLMGPAVPQVESLAIAQGSRVQASDRSYKLVLQNSGTGDASIILIEVGGVGVASVDTPVNKYPVVVKAGTILTVEGKVGFAGACVQGAQHVYHVYTAAGHDYTGWLYVS